MLALTRILALVGVIAIGLAAWFGPKAMGYMSAFNEFDPKAKDVYMGMAERLLESGNSAEATVWTVKVADGYTAEEINESIQAIAIDRNIKAVGVLPLGAEVAAMTGSEWRHLTIHEFCNPLTAAKMIEHNISYAAYLPCRVALVEDENGDLWINTMDMDMMIYGGSPLPPELKEAAEAVKDIIQDILARASEGEF